MKPATLALAVLAGVAPLLCLRGFYDAANLPQSAWIAAVGWLWLAVVLRERQARLSPPPTVLLMALLWSGLSLVWAEWRAEGVRLWLHWLSCAAIGLGARALWRSSRDAFPVLVALTASAGLVAVTGLAQYFLGFALLPQAIAPAATFVNKNVGAGFVLLAWPLGACLLRGLRRSAWTAVVGLALGLQALYVFVAFSRAVWLALGAQFLAALLFAARHWPGRWRLTLGACVLALVVALGLAGPRLPGAAGEAVRHLTAAGRALTSEATDDLRVVSARGRLAVWANTLVMIRSRPLLGLGLGGHVRQYPQYANAAYPDPLFGAGSQLNFVHNDYLQVAAELGLVGLALWMAALGLAARALWARASRGVAEERHVAGAVGLMLIGLCVDACFSFPLERALPPLLVALGLAAALVPASAGERHVPRALAWSALAVGVCLSLLCGRWMQADRQLAKLFESQARGDMYAARRAAEQALLLDPAAYPAAFALGRTSLDLRQPREALRWLETATRARPLDPATLGTRAEAWGAVGDLEHAIVDSRRVAELLPRDAQVWHELGRWLERAGRVSEARDAHRQACVLQPARADFQLRLAVAASRSGAREEALQAAEAALRLDPRAALAHKLLGVLLLDDPSRRNEGLEHVRSALALDPQIADAGRLRSLLEHSDAPAR